MFGRILRLTLPVLSLLCAYGLAYATRQMPLALFDNWTFLSQGGLNPSQWLSLGHLALMLAFFFVMLTNRMYGPAYAFAQLLIVWLIGGGIYVAGFADLNRLLHQDGTLPDPPALFTFLAALVFAHLASLVQFDNMRGRPWWRAPLLSGLTAAVILPALYWPTLYLGLHHAPGTDWIARLALDLALKSVLAVLLLAPYALLRPLTRPRDGFGGY